MNRIEDEIHSLLRTKVAQAPVHEEPPRIVLNRARRRRARNVASAGAAIALVVFGIVSLNGLGTDGTVVPLKPPTVVPWLPVPFEGEAPLHDPPACRADDLDFVPLSEGPASVGFRPKDPGLVCLLDSSFELRLLDPAGKDLGVRVIRGIRQTSFPPGVYVEKPERVTAFVWKWDSGCTPITDPITYVVTLPNGAGTLRAVAPAVTTPCDVARTPSVLRLITHATLEQPDIRVQTIADLDVEISSLPRSVRRGTTLRYRVTLTNSTRAVISLDPCPGYEQSISIGEPTIAIHLLNCDEAPGELAPGEGSEDGEAKPGDAVTFAMELAIPSDFPVGDARLAWRLFGREDLPPTAFVEITA